MKLETFHYTIGKGWSRKDFPALDSPNTLILVFAAPEIADYITPLQELAEHYKTSKIIGCSSSGEICGPSVLDKSLSVAVACFENTRIEIAKTPINNPQDSFATGEQLATQLYQNDLQGILVLSDGLKTNGTALVNGLNSVAHHVKITGGLAGDGDRFRRTWVIFGGELVEGHAAAVGFYGKNIHIGHASLGGWDIFGPERQITRSSNNILYELDAKPALELYKEYLGDRAAGLPATGLLYPLAIRQGTSESTQLVRTILAVDEGAQSLIFAGDIPTGYYAQLMRANFDRLIESAGEAGEIAKKMIMTSHNENDDVQGPILSVAISCVGRRLLLGERTEEETEAVLSTLPTKTMQVGFYSYGELSPDRTGKCELHNQTMTLTTFYET